MLDLLLNNCNVPVEAARAYHIMCAHNHHTITMSGLQDNMSYIHAHALMSFLNSRITKNHFDESDYCILNLFFFCYYAF